MNKLILIFIAFIGIAQLTFAAPHIVIGDRKLVRAYAPADSEDNLREYLPEGENLKHWSCLASVRVFKNETDPEKFLKRVAELARKSSPAAVGRFFRNEEKKDTLLDFIVFEPPNAPEHFAEWSMMRAKFIKGTGLVVYQYALRFYPLSEKGVEVIKAERRKMMGPFVNASFDEEKKTNQSSEPTPTSGTSAAEQPLVPAAVVAHL
jgi:hypothetical protein